MRNPLRLICFFSLLAIPAFAQHLPRTVIPEHYSVQFAPDLGRGTFEGEETIRVSVREPVSSIELNALDLQLSGVTVTAKGTSHPATVTLDSKSQIAKFALTEPLAAGPAEIHLTFSGKLGDDLRGFYQSHTPRRKYAVTQFEPVDARRAFPCFDEPDLKATFDLAVIVDDGDTAVSNGRIISDQPGPATGKHTIRFSTSPRMSTYLAAMTVGDFQCVQDTINDVPIRICTPPEDKGRTQFAMQTAKVSLAFYERYFGIKYPFGKLDITVGPDFIEGMENAGSIYCNDEILLDEKEATLVNEQYAADTLSHEIAHQWFGDLVTMKGWNDTWLNEGFASWISGKPLRQWRPDWNPPDWWTMGMSLDSLRATHPVRTNVEDPAQLFTAFDLITYGKTALVLRMLKSYLGEETFRAGVSSYLKKHAFGNATAEDLWSSLAEASHKPIVPMMRSFIEQPGVPLVTVESACKDGNTEVTLSQKRYFFDRAMLTKDSPERWQIPVCLRRTSGKQCRLFAEAKQTFEIPHCESWLIANANAHGYYRTAYSPQTFAALIANARSLSISEHLALLHDSWALAQSGQSAVSDYLKVVQAIDVGESANVAEQVSRDLDYLDDHLVSDADRAAFQARVRQLLRPAATKLGWNSAANESDEQRRLRATLLLALGTTGEDPDAISEAKRRTEHYLSDPTSLDATLAEKVLTIAAWNGDAALFDQLAAKAKASKTHDDLFRYLSAMRGFRDPALVRRAIETIRSSTQPGELYIIMPVMLRKAATRIELWEYLKTHWKEIDEHQLYFGRVVFIDTLGSFCDAAHRREVQTFFTANDPKDAGSALPGALEQIDYCIDFRQMQQTAFESWLK